MMLDFDMFLSSDLVSRAFCVTICLNQTCASQPLESPSFLEKSKIDLSIVKEETYKEVLWYKNSRHD